MHVKRREPQLKAKAGLIHHIPVSQMPAELGCGAGSPNSQDQVNLIRPLPERH